MPRFRRFHPFWFPAVQQHHNPLQQRVPADFRYGRYSPLTAAMRTLNMANARSSNKDLALVALCFLRAAFLSAHFPSYFFRANALGLSLSSRCFQHTFLPLFFRHVGCSTSNKPRLLRCRHFCLLACSPQASLLSSLRVPSFQRGWYTNFAAAGTVPAENDIPLLGYITTSRCCWQACSVSIDEFSHLSTS